MNTRTATTAALLLALAGTTQTRALDLACLNGQNGFVLNGVDAGDYSGISVSSAGDINGDGFDDIIIGAHRAEVNRWYWAGESYVVFGGPGVGTGGTIELSSLDGTNGFVLQGILNLDFSGRSVSDAGDINGDGIDDLLIGAYGARHNAYISRHFTGESYVVFGGADVGSTGTIELSSLNGTNGFILNGINGNDNSGFSVSGAGDINADGVEDLIIGAHRAHRNGTFDLVGGQSYVVFGGAGFGSTGNIELSSLSGTNGFALDGIDAADESGYSVSGAGDINGDAIDDIIIGARFADPNGGRSGQSYVVFGREGIGASGSIPLSSLSGTNGFVLNGIDVGDFSGSSVSSAGDVNGDGIDDIIIGAINADPNGSNSGESYVVFGNDNIGSTGSIELSSLDGTTGFVINGIDRNDRIGFSVSDSGDVNGDGIDDLIIGTQHSNLSNTGNPVSYVIFGGTSVGASGPIELSSLDATTGFAVSGIDTDIFRGVSVSGAGDINGDGINDVIIGDNFASPNDNTYAGQTYVIFGSTTGFTAPEDLNASGCVTADDLTLVIAAWNTPDADLNNDGTTNSTDLALLLAAWTN